MFARPRFKLSLPMPLSPDSKDEEIDIVHFVRRLVQIVWRHGRLLGLALTLGLAGGLASYLLQPNVYESSLLGNGNVLTGAQVKLMITTLRRSIAENDATVVARQLRTNPAAISKLVSVEAETLLEADPQKTNGTFARRDSSVFIITVRTTDPAVFDSLQAGLVHYLSQNDYSQRVVNGRREYLETLQQQLQGQVRQLDSLRGSVYSLFARSPATSSTLLLYDPGSINRDLLVLRGRQLDLSRQLALLDPIYVVQGFFGYSLPVSPRWPKSLALGAGAGLALGLLLVLALEVRRLMASPFPSPN